VRLVPALVAVAALAAGAALAADPVQPLSQEGRPPASIALAGPDLRAGNANWQAGLNAAAQWIWSANLIPTAFDNNLAHFLLQTPGTFEPQLPYSAMIFDEASSATGQMSASWSHSLREWP
jgi:hypothetical protein